MDKISLTISGCEIKAEKGLTILDAMIASGINVIGHVGCKNGVCGACTCIVRYPNGKLKPRLACRELTSEGIVVSFPEVKIYPKKYSLEDYQFNNGIISELYPEIYNCVNCGMCTNYCTKGIDARKMVENAKYGDLESISNDTFECISCGACSLRCPAKINHSEISLIARRLFSLYFKHQPNEPQEMYKRINNGEFDADLNNFIQLDDESLKILYIERIKK